MPSPTCAPFIEPLRRTRSSSPGVGCAPGRPRGRPAQPGLDRAQAQPATAVPADAPGDARHASACSASSRRRRRSAASCTTGSRGSSATTPLTGELAADRNDEDPAEDERRPADLTGHARRRREARHRAGDTGSATAPRPREDPGAVASWQPRSRAEPVTPTGHRSRCAVRVTRCGSMRRGRTGTRSCRSRSPLGVPGQHCATAVRRRGRGPVRTRARPVRLAHSGSGQGFVHEHTSWFSSFRAGWMVIVVVMRSVNGISFGLGRSCGGPTGADQADFAA